MARKRMIYPEFFSSATLASLEEIPAMVTFAGLWIYCDDEGRGEDDVRLIMSTVWPRNRKVSEENVADHLDALADRFLIHRYTVGEFPLFHVPSWFEHQKISHPTASKLPPCPACDPDLFKVWWKNTDTGSQRFRTAEKALRRRKTGQEELPIDSGEDRELIANESGTIPRQFSVVKESLDKGTSAGAAREKRRTFTRPSLGQTS